MAFCVQVYEKIKSYCGVKFDKTFLYFMFFKNIFIYNAKIY